MVLEPGALAAKQNADILAGRNAGRGKPRGFRRVDHGLGLVVGARSGRKHQGAVGDRSLDRVEQPGVREDAVGARGDALCAPNSASVGAA